MELGESREDYLEAVYILSKQHDVRIVDLAALLERKLPTVSVAVRELGKKEYVSRDERGCVRLTEKGRQVAEKVYGRHCYYRGLLARAGVEPEQAEREGCRMEHVLSDDSHRKLKDYIEKLEKDRQEPDGRGRTGAAGV